MPPHGVLTVLTDTYSSRPISRVDSGWEEAAGPPAQAALGTERHVEGALVLDVHEHDAGATSTHSRPLPPGLLALRIRSLACEHLVRRSRLNRNR